MKTITFFISCILFMTIFTFSQIKPACEPVKPEEPVCTSPGDCSGLPHIECDGEWQCTEGSCIWECGLKCIEEGEKFYGSDHKCCEGLVPVPECIETENGCACTNCMCSVCTKCGDGICGKGENKCNCPEDCEKNECKTLDPYGYGVCAMVLGYVYTGKECKLASGCSCKPDCDYFFKTKEDCEKACIPAKSCIVSGCSGEICATESMMSICIWKPEYACLKYSECGLFGENSTCAWKKTEAYLDCLKDINNKNY